MADNYLAIAALRCGSFEAAYMADNGRCVRVRGARHFEAAYMADNRKLSAKTACEPRFEGAISVSNHVSSSEAKSSLIC